MLSKRTARVLASATVFLMVVQAATPARPSWRKLASCADRKVGPPSGIGGGVPIRDQHRGSGTITGWPQPEQVASKPAA